MQTIRRWVVACRVVIAVVIPSMLWIQVSPAFAVAYKTSHPASTYVPLTAKQRAKLVAELSKPKKQRDVIALTPTQMHGILGRGIYRNPYFDGTMPWQRSFHDVNVDDGNLFKSFTDMQVSPAVGAGLVLQRTYNSNDASIGPFGIGWTHAYDICIQEASQVQAQDDNYTIDGTPNDVPRTDFFGNKFTYHRDADGLYTPPPYMFDQMSSSYNNELVNGPPVAQTTTDIGMDGTVKQYFINGNEQDCSSITDRFGNTTTLTYQTTLSTMPDGSQRYLLDHVTDPSGRQIHFVWTNIESPGPVWRITSVVGPLQGSASNPSSLGTPVSGVTYTVSYSYYVSSQTPTAAELDNLKSVSLDSTGMNRTTSFDYTSVTDGQGNTENGLLASIADPLGEEISYTYTLNGEDLDANFEPDWTGSVWVNSVTEPAGVNTSNVQRQITYNIVTGTNDGPEYGDPCTTWVTAKDPSDNNAIITFMIIGSTQYCQIQTVGLAPVYTLYQWTYDTDNNVLWHKVSTQTSGAGYDGLDQYQFGAHGNQLSHNVNSSGPTSTPAETSTYYNLSQYFQKSSDSDMDGHTVTYQVGDDLAGTTGYTQDTNPGDRGNVLSVQDAFYNDSSPASNHNNTSFYPTTIYPQSQYQYVYTYNQYGQKSSETNENGVVTDYTYGGPGNTTDPWGNLVQVVQDPGTGHLNRTTSMVYDIAGHVLQSTDPSGKTSIFTYNVLGQVLTAEYPANGSVSGETVSYVYAANGRTSTVADHRGTTTFAYEAGSDRVSSVTDPVTGTISYTYTLAGLRATMKLPGDTGSQQFAYTYSSSGPWYVPYPSSTGSGLNVYGYFYLPDDTDLDKVSQTLSYIEDDQGKMAWYSFSGVGQLIEAKTDAAYTPGGAPSPCLDTVYTYDTNTGASPQWLTSMSTTWDTSTGDTLLHENQYTYDNAGLRLTNKITDNTGTVRTETYGYDDDSRLTNVNYGDAGTAETQSYSFDPMGNRTQLVDNLSGNTNYSFDAANRILTKGSQDYTSDADGNTITDGARTNTWDSENRLVKCIDGANTITNDYGCDGLRRQQIVTNSAGTATTDYAYDGQNMSREMQTIGGSLAPTATYLIGPRGPEYKYQNQNGTIAWYIYDGLGSQVGEVGPTGTVTYTPKYDVYGAVRGNTGSATSRQGFVGGLGHITDTESGLIYMRARYYDPGIGRFLSEDPGGHGGNWYSYCDDDPTNAADQSGKNPVLIVAAAYVLLSAVVAGILAAITATSGSFWSNFARGFWEGAVVAGATLAGPVAGLLVGALVGWIDAKLTGGNQAMGAIAGGFGGLLGGVLGVVAAEEEGQLIAYCMISLIDDGSSSFINSGGNFVAS